MNTTEELNEVEQAIVDALKENFALEGNILVGMFNAEHLPTINGLVEKNILKIEDNIQGRPCVRLVGVDYPKTFEEIMAFRIKYTEEAKKKQ